MNTITPPKNLNDLPEKLLCAWKSLGCDIDDEDILKFQNRWEEHDAFAPYGAQQYSRKEIPVRQFPGWSEAIIDIVNLATEDDIKTHGQQLLRTLNCFLDATSLYGLTKLTPLLIEANIINGPIPRDLLEFQDLVSVIPRLEGDALQRHAIKNNIVASNLPSQHPSQAEIDKALLMLIPNLDADTLSFPYDPDRDYTFIGSDAAHYFCERLESPELFVQLIRYGNKNLRLTAFDRISSIANNIQYNKRKETTVTSDAIFNPELLELITEHTLEYVNIYDPWTNQAVNDALWASNTDEGRELAVVGAIKLFGENVNNPQALEEIKSRYAEFPNIIGSNIFESLGRYELNEISLLCHLEIDSLQFSILNVIARKINNDGDADYYIQSWIEKNKADINRAELAKLIKNGLITQKSKLASMLPGDLAALAPFIDNDELALSTLPELQAHAAKSKPLRKALGITLSSLSPNVFSNWLSDRRKGVREVALEGMVRNPSLDAVPFLRHFHDNPKSSDADKDLIASRLAELGKPTIETSSRDELSIDSLQEKALTAKIKPQVKKIWNAELASSFLPFDEQTALWLLTMTFEFKGDVLPSTVIGALELLPQEQQAQISECLVNVWIANNGDSKHRWLTKFVPDFADDRVVDPLMKSFQGWFKRAKPKSVFVLETLGKLDTKYSLSQVMNLYGKNTYSYSLQKGAGDTLRAAAKRRNVQMIDLFDELTPDFGLDKSGLMLNVGPYSYIVKVSGDLSLSVHNEQTTKQTKTFPKIKKGEDSHLHANAESRFKLLRSNLKKVAKQQGKRLREAMVSERKWPLARWKVLFLEHPLLCIAAQSMVWDAGTNKSFRISEDLTLISSDDSIVELTDSDEIKLWHPVNSTKQEVDSWAQHLNGYGIEPMFDQVGQLSVQITEEELVVNSIKRFAGIKVEGQIISQYMKSWNYEQDDVDGSSITDYICRFRLAGIAVVLELDDMDVFPIEGFPATIQSFEFFKDNGPVPLSEVPLTLISEIIRQGETLKTQAVE